MLHYYETYKLSSICKHLIHQKTMHLTDAILSSFQTILSHKFRSFLTLLGIVIGITSVVAMFSSVNGIKTIMETSMEGMGWNNNLIVTTKSGDTRVGGRGFMVMYRSQSAARRVKPLNYNDYENLRSEIDTKYIFGMAEIWSRTIENKWIRMRATTPDYFHANTYPIARGRYFSAFELNRGEKVAIVGPLFSEEHFRGEDPLEQYFTLGENRFRIVGILDEDQLNKRGSMQMNPWGRRWDLQGFYIPLKTGCIYYRQNMALDYISLYSHDSESFPDMKSRTNQVLLATHNMQKDFEFNDIAAEMLEVTAQLEDMMSKWSVTLIAIASISLLVGGIGLFSTLLISINERMMEIGIRKSIGARDVDIFFYFIMEALTLSAIAAAFGIAFGTLLSVGMGMALKMSIPVSMVSVYVGLAFALIIGFLSGLYPALKAAGINPIQAIYFNE